MFVTGRDPSYCEVPITSTAIEFVHGCHGPNSACHNTAIRTSRFVHGYHELNVTCHGHRPFSGPQISESRQQKQLCLLILSHDVVCVASRPARGHLPTSTLSLSPTSPPLIPFVIPVIPSQEFVHGGHGPNTTCHSTWTRTFRFVHGGYGPNATCHHGHHSSCLYSQPHFASGAVSYDHGAVCLTFYGVAF